MYVYSPTKVTFPIYYLNFHCTFVELWQRQRQKARNRRQRSNQTPQSDWQLARSSKQLVTCGVREKKQQQQHGKKWKKATATVYKLCAVFAPISHFLFRKERNDAAVHLPGQINHVWRCPYLPQAICATDSFNAAWSPASNSPSPATNSSPCFSSYSCCWYQLCTQTFMISSWQRGSDYVRGSHLWHMCDVSISCCVIFIFIFFMLILQFSLLSSPSSIL